MTDKTVERPIVSARVPKKLKTKLLSLARRADVTLGKLVETILSEATNKKAKR